MKNRYSELLKVIAEEHELSRNLSRDSRVLIIDGLNTFIRVFSAVPALNDNGDHVGGVVGFLRSIALSIRQFNPTRCIIVFDGKGGSHRRRKIYSDYKGNRVTKTKLNRHDEFDTQEDEAESMKMQFSRVIQYLMCLPITTMAIDHIEADDAIAYLATNIFDKSDQVTIVSTDRDFLQLINDRIRVWSPVKKILYTPDVLHNELGIHATNYLTYRVIIGDKSDNIPKIKGIGRKTLIKHFPELGSDKHIDIDELIRISENTQKKQTIHKTILNSLEHLQVNYDLMQLKDVDISGNLKLMIKNIVDQPVNRTNVLQFKKMFMYDKLFNVVKDVNAWLGSFNTLNSFAS